MRGLDCLTDRAWARKASPRRSPTRKTGARAQGTANQPEKADSPNRGQFLIMVPLVGLELRIICGLLRLTGTKSGRLSDSLGGASHPERLRWFRRTRTSPRRFRPLAGNTGPSRSNPLGSANRSARRRDAVGCDRDGRAPPSDTARWLSAYAIAKPVRDAFLWLLTLVSG